jgi:hypothetical protein
MALTFASLSQQLSRLSARERVLGGAILAAAILMGYYLFLYEPLVNRETRLKGEAKALEGEIAGLSLQMVEFGRRVEEVKRLEAQLKTTRIGEEGVLPDRGKLSLLLDDLTSGAKGGRVNVLSVIPSAVVDKGAFLEFGLKIQLRARFRDLGTYLDRLETAAWPVSVQNLRVEATAALLPEVQAQLDTVAYLRKE